MDRLKPLEMWETTEEGFPVLKDSEDAIRFAMASFECSEVYETLIKQLDSLRCQYEHLKSLKSNLSNIMGEIAFNVQFTNDAIREIVKLLRQQTILEDVDTLWTKLCPFCERALIDHSDNGDCPE